MLSNPQQVLGGLVHLNEHSVVDLPQSEELHNLPDLGTDLVDTADSHDEHHLLVSVDGDKQHFSRVILGNSFFNYN